MGEKFAALFSSGTGYFKSQTTESPDVMDATVIIVFGCSENFKLFYCVFDIKKRCIFICKMVLYFVFIL